MVEEFELELWVRLARNDAGLTVFEAHFMECPSGLGLAKTNSGEHLKCA